MRHRRLGLQWLGRRRFGGTIRRRRRERMPTAPAGETAGLPGAGIARIGGAAYEVYRSPAEGRCNLRVSTAAATAFAVAPRSGAAEDGERRAFRGNLP